MTGAGAPSPGPAPPAGRLLAATLIAIAALGCGRRAPADRASPAATAAPSTATAPVPTSDRAAVQRQLRIVAIATAYAAERGVNTGAIKLRSVSESNGTARVFFEQQPARPGGHFTVLVDVDRGQATRFIPGH